MSSDERNSKHADTSSSRTATLSSFHICGKITARKCGNDCEGNLQSRYGVSANATFSLGATASESHRFFGRGKTTGFFSRLKLRDCSHQAWSRCAQIAAASITSSRSAPCPVRERVLKVSNFCHLAIFLASLPQTETVRVRWCRSERFGKWIFPIRVRRNAAKIRSDSLTSSRTFC